MIDETAIKQRCEGFVLFAAINPETRHLLNDLLAWSRNYLTTRRFLTEIGEFYGRVPPIVVPDGAIYGPVLTSIGVTHIVRRHSVRNCTELQELKRQIELSYASFTNHVVDTTNN
jgi:putative transposase